MFEDEGNLHRGGIIMRDCCLLFQDEVEVQVRKLRCAVLICTVVPSVVHNGSEWHYLP